MQSITFELRGTQPLLLANPRMVHPFDEYRKKIEPITDKRVRTDDDHRELSWLYWCAALYYDNDIGPYVPQHMVYASVLVAARMYRMGQQIIRGLHMTGSKLALQYKGPRGLKELYAHPEFLDVRDGTINGKKRVIIYRPCFTEWSLTVTFVFDEEQLNEDEIKFFMKKAGKYIGIGTYRQRFGRFSVRVIDTHPVLAEDDDDDGTIPARLQKVRKNKPAISGADLAAVLEFADDDPPPVVKTQRVAPTMRSKAAPEPEPESEPEIEESAVNRVRARLAVRNRKVAGRRHGR